MTRIAILGAGPAGLGAAYQLRSLGLADVTVFERGALVGGNAGSFDWNGHRLDFGSHRLHPSCDPRIMADLKTLLRDDLLDRPRHGRIRLLGKWVHFPLKPLDLLLHVNKRFLFGTLSDMGRKLLPGRSAKDPNFATVLEENLGSTICRYFYFPYARKIWGVAPERLSAIQARKRVSAGTFGKLLRKILGQVPLMKKKGAGRFFYPRGGFGEICEKLSAGAASAGADVRLSTEVLELVPPNTEGGTWVIASTTGGKRQQETFDYVWSTIPLTVAVQMMRPSAPEPVLLASRSIDYRAMILIYLEFPVPQFSAFDAHYFPEEGIRITRLSEPKNYALRSEPKDRTVLCAELPCARGDALWNLGDEELGALVQSDLIASGLQLPAKPIAVTTRRLPQAYPLYPDGYEKALTALDAYGLSLPRFLSYGRQGLFAHDNTHHALAMAYAAVACFDGAAFDHRAWNAHRESFKSHVVED